MQRPSEAIAPHGFRRDIQGLRGLAVVLVVAYHLFPSHLTGGYVGVDVFFVISGFLITAKLVAEHTSTGRISLSRFWAGRVRRLLPAALLVLACCVIATWLWAPTSQVESWLRHIVASALYVENWALAAESIDYLGQGVPPTIAQHFWSLSVEEQFYVLWPLVIVATIFLTSRSTIASRPARRVWIVIASLAVLSLIWSAVQTIVAPTLAYFSTFTRAWEFAAGALLALTGATLSRPWLRRAAGWAGVAAICAAALLLDTRSLFPGVVALLPVLGAVAVILAGGTRLSGSVGTVLSLRPAAFLGDISYSVYLWHWPLIVLLPHVLDSSVKPGAELAVAAIVVPLAWATKRWVEDPLRRVAISPPRLWVTFVAAGTAMVIVVAGSGVLQVRVNEQIQAASAAAAVARQTIREEAMEAVRSLAAADEVPASCLGPAALARPEACETSDYVVPPIALADRTIWSLYPGCLALQDDPSLAICELGTTQDPAHTVAVVGDSHATHWLGAFDVIGAALGWRIIAVTKASCPFSAAPRASADDIPGRPRICQQTNAALLDYLTSGGIEAVFTSSFGSAYSWRSELAAGIADFRSSLDAHGIPLFVIRDVPLVKDRISSPTCLELADDPDSCGQPRAAALPPDLYADSARSIGVPVLDLTSSFCDPARCPAVVGGVIVFVDDTHLSQEYSMLLAPALFTAMKRSGTSWTVLTG